MPHSEADWAKIAGPKAEFISAETARRLVSREPGTRPRVYGFWSGQIVSVLSTYDMDRRVCERYWLSGTTVADLVRKA